MPLREVQTLAIAYPEYEMSLPDGSLELAIATALDQRLPRPHKVSNLLEQCFTRISGDTVTAAYVDSLASGTREWLLQQATTLFWRESGWFESICENCGEKFDFQALIERAPVKQASLEFPVAKVCTSLGTRFFEAPNGWHEKHLATSYGSSDPRRYLLACCGLSMQASTDSERYSQADIDAIENELERMTPEVADGLQVDCPNCNCSTATVIDPVVYAFPQLKRLCTEIHFLASTYHWSPDKILSLPSSQRKAFAQLISSDRGTAQVRV